MSEHDDDIRDGREAPEPAEQEHPEQRPGTVATTPSEPARRLLPGWNRPDPRRRPHDPAGTYPKHRPDDLLPSGDEPLVIHAQSPLSAAVPAAGAASAASDAAPAGDAPGEPPHAARFQFVLGAMIAVAVAGVLLLLIAVLDTDESPTTRTIELTGPRWSSWAPYQGSIDGPTQIAEHVGPKYKLKGRQLVAITGGPLEIAGLPLTVALRQPPAAGGGIKLYEGKGVMYRLCGLGENCGIATGKPSRSRHLLIRREALELALYSFRYIKGVSQVVVILPPGKAAGKPDQQQALFFRMQDVARQLTQPLNATISPKTPTVGNVRRSPNIATVDQITVKSLFQFSLTQGNADVRAFLVLDRITS